MGRPFTGTRKAIRRREIAMRVKQKTDDKCACGCGQAVPKRSLYVKGHGKRNGSMDFPSEYRSMKNAISRCNNPKNQDYHLYGGRGIEFRFGSFREFMSHVGPRPAGKSLDRINPDGHYEPGNVRWATQAEQVQNSSKAKLRIEDVDNIKMMKLADYSYDEIADFFEVTPMTIYHICTGRTWKQHHASLSA